MLLKTGGQYCRRLVFNQAKNPLLFTREIPLAVRQVPLFQQSRESVFVTFACDSPDYAGRGENLIPLLPGEASPSRAVVDSEFPPLKS